MNIQRHIARTTVLLATLLMLNACSDEHTNEYFADNSHTLLRVSLNHFSAEGQAQPVSGETNIERMDAYLFEDGILTEYHPQLIAESENSYKLDLQRGARNRFVDRSGLLSTNPYGRGWTCTTISDRTDQADRTGRQFHSPDTEARNGPTRFPCPRSRQFQCTPVRSKECGETDVCPSANRHTNTAGSRKRRHPADLRPRTETGLGSHHVSVRAVQSRP